VGCNLPVTSLVVGILDMRNIDDQYCHYVEFIPHMHMICTNMHMICNHFVGYAYVLWDMQCLMHMLTTSPDSDMSRCAYVLGICMCKKKLVHMNPSICILLYNSLGISIFSHL